MQKKSDFIDWLDKNTELATSTQEKYAGAINTISTELQKYNLLEQNLYFITDPVMIESYKVKYFQIPEYRAKDSRGNRMYSNALKYFVEYVESTK